MVKGRGVAWARRSGVSAPNSRPVCCCWRVYDLICCDRIGIAWVGGMVWCAGWESSTRGACIGARQLELPPCVQVPPLLVRFCSQHLQHLLQNRAVAAASHRTAAAATTAARHAGCKHTCSQEQRGTRTGRPSARPAGWDRHFWWGFAAAWGDVHNHIHTHAGHDVL